MHNPRAGPGHKRYDRPSQQVKKYKKLLVNDGDLWKNLNFIVYWQFSSNLDMAARFSSMLVADISEVHNLFGPRAAVYDL